MPGMIDYYLTGVTMSYILIIVMTVNATNPIVA